MANLKTITMIFLSVILFIELSIANSSQTLSVTDVEELITQIEAAENRLNNVRIKAEVWQEQASSPDGPWEQAKSYVQATSWLDGRSKDKGKVNVHSEISRISLADSEDYEHREQSYTASYDGQAGRLLFHKDGKKGQPQPAEHARIMDSVPQIVRGIGTGLVTSRRFTLNYFFVDAYKDAPSSFSQWLKMFIQPEAQNLAADFGQEYKFVPETYEGVESVRFTIKAQADEAPSVEMHFWFDPNRGFALLGHENVRYKEPDNKFVDTRIKVTKLEKVDDGIWWPVEGAIESDRQIREGVYARTVFRALNVVANDPDFDNDIFTIPFPEGTRVHDELADKTYVVGDEDK